MNKQMITQIESALGNESLIETVYRNELRKHLGGEWSKPHQCDGVLTLSDGYKILIEAKADCFLLNRENIASVLQQVLYYLKRFDSVPDLVLLVEKSTYVLFPTNIFLPLLMKTDIDWGVAPSDMFKKEGVLYRELIFVIKKYLYFVFELDREDFTDLIEMINDYRQGYDNKKYIFKYREERVLGDKLSKIEDLNFMKDKGESFKRFLLGKGIDKVGDKDKLFTLSRKCDFGYFSESKVLTYAPYNFSLFDKYLESVDMLELELREMYKWWLKKIFMSEENKVEYRTIFKKVIMGEGVIVGRDSIDGVIVDIKSYHEFFMWFYKYPRPDYKQKYQKQVQVEQ